MAQLKILMAACEAAVHRRGPLTTVISCPDGCNAEGFMDARERGEDFGAAASRFSDDTTILEIRQDKSGVACEVHIFRSVTTSRELFYHVDKLGNLWLSDHFRNLLPAVPMESRRIPIERVIEHLLFCLVPGRHSHLQGVHRLGHGQALQLISGADGLRSSQAEKFESALDGQVPADAAEVVDRTLGEVMHCYANHPGVANMLSGGVDSTLLQAYLGHDVPSVSGAMDSPEFAFEIDYARQASALVGSQHQVLGSAESDFLSDLETCIEVLGTPPSGPQTVYLDPVYRSQYARFFCGQFADTLFGTTFSAYAAVAWRRRHLAAVARALGTHKFALSSAMARKLNRSADDPRGFAMQFSIFSDEDVMRRVFGDDAVDARLAALLNDMRDSVSISNGDNRGLHAHLHIGHLLEFFRGDVLGQLALSRGKTFCTPYANRRVVRSSLRVPASHRFLKGLRAKYLLKQLLEAKVPGYVVDQTKGAGGLPIERFCTSGPLSKVWEKYAVPDAIAPVNEAIAGKRPSILNWNLITFAIWYRRVLQNPLIKTVPNTRTLEWKLSEPLQLRPTL